MNYLKKELYELIKSDIGFFDLVDEASLDGLWYWDMEHPENEWISPQFWMNLGYPADEMPHQSTSWQQVMHPDDLKFSMDNFNKHRNDQAHPYDQVVRYMHKDGSTVWMRRKGKLIRNAQGRANRMVGAHINITTEKNSEEKHRILFDSIDEGFCIIEVLFDANKKPVDYRFLVINASFERQTGMHDAVGKRMREFAPNHEEHWFETYGKIALSGESIRFENRAEQLHRWYDVYAFRFGDPKDHQVAILFNDITSRKEAEETIKLLNQDLESFSYSVSHDLRSPLRAINGYAEILEEDFAAELPEEAKRYLASIRENSKKMGNLINDMLDFAKLGRKEAQKSEVDTESLVRGIVDEIGNQYSLGKDNFNIGKLPPSFGDKALLKQVWMNLISNACKYSQKNPKPLVEIGSETGADAITFSVKDNGSGFDMAYYDKLFAVFQRLHTEKEFDGTGVGLAIVERIVARHGGRVWAEGKVDAGASFYFTVPLS